MHVLLAALRRELPQWDVAPADGGWSLWITLPAGSSAALAQTALRHGVAIASGGASSPEDAFPECVRICHGPGPPLLEEAARRSATACNEFTPRAIPFIILASA